MPRHTQEKATVTCYSTTAESPAEPLVIYATCALFGASCGYLSASAENAQPSADGGQSSHSDRLRQAVAVMRRDDPRSGTPTPFLEKARHAQRAGAAALIIVNYQERPFMLDCNEDASDVVIPVFCVRHQWGNMLMQRLPNTVVIQSDREVRDDRELVHLRAHVRELQQQLELERTMRAEDASSVDLGASSAARTPEAEDEEEESDEEEEEEEGKDFLSSRADPPIRYSYFGSPGAETSSSSSEGEGSGDDDDKVPAGTEPEPEPPSPVDSPPPRPPISHRPPPPPGPPPGRAPGGRMSDRSIETVPGDGQCLFNSIDQTQICGGSVHGLRKLVVEWVRDNWSANPDMSSMMPHLAELLNGKLRLHDVFEEVESERDLKDYLQRMARYNEYGSDREAAIAAYILGYSVTIYHQGKGGDVRLELPVPLGMDGGVARSIVMTNRDSGCGAHYDIYRPTASERQKLRSAAAGRVATQITAARAGTEQAAPTAWVWEGISAHGQPVSAAMVPDIQVDKRDTRQGRYYYDESNPERCWRVKSNELQRQRTPLPVKIAKPPEQREYDFFINHPGQAPAASPSPSRPALHSRPPPPRRSSGSAREGTSSDDDGTSSEDSSDEDDGPGPAVPRPRPPRQRQTPRRPLPPPTPPPGTAKPRPSPAPTAGKEKEEPQRESAHSALEEEEEEDGTAEEEETSEDDTPAPAPPQPQDDASQSPPSSAAVAETAESSEEEATSEEDAIFHSRVRRASAPKHVEGQ
jgi:hypothetical protein